MKNLNYSRVCSLLLLISSTIFYAPTSFASEALADTNACLNCHMVEKKMVGPAFKAIAAKYKGQANAEAYLIEKIQKGGKGVWGAVPMPPMAQVEAADAQILAKWILTK